MCALAINCARKVRARIFKPFFLVVRARSKDHSLKSPPPMHAAPQGIKPWASLSHILLQHAFIFRSEPAAEAAAGRRTEGASFPYSLGGTPRTALHKAQGRRRHRRSSCMKGGVRRRGSEREMGMHCGRIVAGLVSRAPFSCCFYLEGSAGNKHFYFSPLQTPNAT
jgi:hypothetical protein